MMRAGDRKLGINKCWPNTTCTRWPPFLVIGLISHTTNYFSLIWHCARPNVKDKTMWLVRETKLNSCRRNVHHWWETRIPTGIAICVAHTIPRQNKHHYDHRLYNLGYDSANNYADSHWLLSSVDYNNAGVTINSLQYGDRITYKHRNLIITILNS